MQKEQECEELKKFYEEWNPQMPIITNTIGNFQLQVKAWREQADRYKQALEKIESFCKDDLRSLDIEDFQYMILIIINEVKNEQ